MSDDEFLRGFESGALEGLPHRSHVRLAWLYLDRLDEGEVLEHLVAGLKRFAAAKGQPGKFHYTMTRAWLELIQAARLSYPDARDVDDLLAACPALASSRVLERYYSNEALSSAAARADWVPPDLAPLSGSV